MAKTLFGMTKFVLDLPEILTADILELTPLEQVPNAFLGIELGCIAGQGFQVNALGCPLRQELLECSAAMKGGAIPDDEQLPRPLAQ